ncbi:hypothetical protein [Niveispirillum sp. BGYR6]|uniref:hypothetical protein n=1 Tax=Niveispirillum sp. BGYR6 TaxID=2971249 RepID=UPI0022B9B9DA|nr:hypothetical protein [Niveispirillum sp. BGYR6]MDG5496814.1 hypothetical protein [Niveispirillum sp. BGYR6]
MATVTGTASADTLTGTDGYDDIRGGDGDDIINLTTGNDNIDGGNGYDIYRTNISSSAVQENYRNLAEGTILGFLLSWLENGNLNSSNIQSIINVERIDFTDQSLLFTTGTAGNDRLIGNNDTLNAINAGAGADTVTGGRFRDFIGGGAGADSLSGGDGDDVFFPGRMEGDTVDGGAGTDRVALAYYLNSDLRFSVTDGVWSDWMGGSLTLINVEQFELTSGDGNDTITGGVLAERFSGGAGNDSLTGNGGNDTLIGGTGRDTLAGGDGDDQLYVSLPSNSSAAVILGTLMQGGAGNDSLTSGTGRDTLLGGDGNDLLSLRSATLPADLPLAGNLLDGGDGDDSLIGDIGSGDTLLGGAGNDTISVSAPNGLTGGLLDGGEGNDLISSAGGTGTLKGGAGNDTLYSSLPRDGVAIGGNLLDGGAGNDSLRGGGGQDTLQGGEGDDDLDIITFPSSGTRGSRSLLMEGGAGNDKIWGGLGTDTLNGGDGNDQLGISRISGLSDIATKGLRLDGGAGNDTLTGGRGNDTLIGGEGQDQAVYALAKSAVTITRNEEDGSFTLVSSAGGTDRLSGVETLVFNDGRVDLTNWGRFRDAYWIDAFRNPTDASWATATQAPVSVSYAFYSALPTGYTAANYPDFSPLTEAEKTQARTALANYASVTGLSFVEVNDPAAANIRFGTISMTTAYGFANYPAGGQADVWLANNVYTTRAGLADNWYIFHHELLHALGLKHATTLYGNEPPQLSPTEVGAGSLFSLWNSSTERLRDFDVAALQYYYGPDPAVRSGDDVYSITGASTATHFFWDGGGSDRMDLSGASAGVQVSLVPGSLNWIGTAATSVVAANAFTINHGSWIERLTGSAFADQLEGNYLANQIDGGAGNDTILATDGDDTIIGGTGEDVLVFNSAASTYAITTRSSDQAMILTGAGRTITSFGVESFRFTDAEIDTTGRMIDKQMLLNGKLVSPTRAATAFGQEWALAGTSSGDIVIGTNKGDLINALEGDDAVNSGAGDDIIDGGLGSNFLTGSAGSDRFFIDGRNASGAANRTSWSTVTDFQRDAKETITIWGWDPTRSKIVLDERSGGADGYKGATWHLDMDGDGKIDVSLTLTGLGLDAVTRSTGVVDNVGYLLLG